MPESILCPEDALRAASILFRLAAHRFHFSVTGGLATEIVLGQAGRRRALNDLDLVVAHFGALPVSLAREFLVSHVHPSATRGRLLIQLVDRDERIRIDIFQACGATLARTSLRWVAGESCPVVSVEDLTVRTALSLLAVHQGRTAPRKFWVDYRRLCETVDPGAAERIWTEHRRDGDPSRWADADSRIRAAIGAHPSRLVSERYETDVTVKCPRCDRVDGFPLASAEEISAILGYC